MLLIIILISNRLNMKYRRLYEKLQSAYDEKYKPSINDMKYNVPTLDYVEQRVLERYYYLEQFYVDDSDDFYDIKGYPEELIDEIFKKRKAQSPKITPMPEDLEG